MTELKTDIAIIGGGVAGLWLHQRLNDLGHHALLIEKNAIGQGQTLSSQGIIHGGAKYTLNGVLSPAASAIAAMPARWTQCLKGEGEINLSQTALLAENQLMWSTNSLSSKLTSFFSSKALQGKVRPMEKQDYPQPFDSGRFKGKVYQLNEPVLDTLSLVRNLSKDWRHRIIDRCTIEHFQLASNNEIRSLQLENGPQIKPDTVIFSAGEGNEALLAQLGIESIPMQRRPLNMVLVKSPSLPPLYAHCIGSSSKPLATITSHRHPDGDWVWYIGGGIAEDGVNSDTPSLIKKTRELLKVILPQLDFSNPLWATHAVNRAEPAQNKLLRPDTAFVKQTANLYVTWPTKLALTPDLADQVINSIDTHGINNPCNQVLADKLLASMSLDSDKPLQTESLWSKLNYALY